MFATRIICKLRQDICTNKLSETKCEIVPGPALKQLFGAAVAKKKECGWSYAWIRNRVLCVKRKCERQLQ